MYIITKIVGNKTYVFTGFKCDARRKYGHRVSVQFKEKEDHVTALLMSREYLDDALKVLTDNNINVIEVNV